MVFPQPIASHLTNTVYNQALKGNFDVNVQMAINEEVYTNGLTSVQIAGLKQAIQNNDPSNAKAQKVIKDAADKALADNDVQQGVWQPSATDLKDSFTRVSSSTTKTNFVNVNEMLNSSTDKIIMLMPDGAAKTSTLNLLQSIGKALAKAQKYYLSN